MVKLYSLIIAVVFLAVAIHGVQGRAMVTGTVFCDQCKDNQVSLFDYPLSGIKVTLVCRGNDEQMTTLGEETTNMVGSYTMSLDGTPDLTTCFTEISPSSNGPNGPGPNGCGAATGPPKPVRLMFSLFDMEMYSVDPLISQPAKPMSFCPSSSSSPPTPVILPPPVVSRPPPVTTPSPPVATPSPPRSPAAPAFRLPPMPPMPFLEASACPHEYWMMPEYKCYWRAVNPKTTVALVFGPLAAKKYGPNMTLWAGLQGRGDPYRTLLREATTALLNSYNTFHFSYNTLQVLYHFNTALMGSNRTVLITALRFKRANSGNHHVTCKFKSCK